MIIAIANYSRWWSRDYYVGDVWSWVASHMLLRKRILYTISTQMYSWQNCVKGPHWTGLEDLIQKRNPGKSFRQCSWKSPQISVGSPLRQQNNRDFQWESDRFAKEVPRLFCVGLKLWEGSFWMPAQISPQGNHRVFLWSRQTKSWWFPHKGMVQRMPYGQNVCAVRCTVLLRVPERAAAATEADAYRRDQFKLRWCPGFKNKKETVIMAEEHSSLSYSPVVWCSRGSKGFFQASFQTVDNRDHGTRPYVSG